MHVFSTIPSELSQLRFQGLDDPRPITSASEHCLQAKSRRQKKLSLRQRRCFLVCLLCIRQDLQPKLARTVVAHAEVAMQDPTHPRALEQLRLRSKVPKGVRSPRESKHARARRPAQVSSKRSSSTQHPRRTLPNPHSSVLRVCTLGRKESRARAIMLPYSTEFCPASEITDTKTFA